MSCRLPYFLDEPIVKYNNQIRMNYRNEQARPKPKQEQQKYNLTPSLYFQGRIPPLISISSNKQRPRNDKISIGSLNQSQVRSIYTVDKEQIDRNTLQIFSRSFNSQKIEKSQRLNLQKQTQRPSSKVNNFQTPILKKQLDLSSKEELKTPIGKLQEFNELQYKNCEAVRLYRTLVEQQIKKINDGEEIEFNWLKDKNQAQLLANVLTNPTRLRLYIHFLMKEMYVNERKKLINQIHQEEIQAYNPNLKQAYTNIICLLSKIIDRPQGKDAEKGPSVSIFENGINIDIDPKNSYLKRENNQKIRQLRHEATEQENNLQQIKKLYEQIIQNYAITIENMNNNQQTALMSAYRPVFKESRVHLQVQQEELDTIRKKNHTFGMKQMSSRSSRQ